MRIVYAVAMSATVLAIGCGGDDDDVNNNAERYEGTEAEVATLVDDFANAGRDGEGEQICGEYFADQLVQSIEEESGQSCPSEVDENLPDEYELTIDSLEVQGDTATVGVTDQDDQSNVLHVERANGAWQVARVTPAE